MTSGGLTGRVSLIGAIRRHVAAQGDAGAGDGGGVLGVAEQAALEAVGGAAVDADEHVAVRLEHQIAEPGLSLGEHAAQHWIVDDGLGFLKIGGE